MQVINTATGAASGNPPSWTVTADTHGNIQTSWVCTSDLAGDTLELDATGASSGLAASETFTDSNPMVLSVSPNAGPTTGAQTVAITTSGYGFGSSDNVTVTFGGTTATNVTLTGGNSLTAVTPSHTAGAVNVTVTDTTKSLSATLTNGYTYNATTSITSLTGRLEIRS